MAIEKPSASTDPQFESHFRELCAKAHLVEVIALTEGFATERFSASVNFDRIAVAGQLVKECCDLALVTGAAVSADVDPLPASAALERLRQADISLRASYLAHACSPDKKTWSGEFARSVGETAIRCARWFTTPSKLESVLRERAAKFRSVRLPDSVRDLWTEQEEAVWSQWYEEQRNAET